MILRQVDEQSFSGGDEIASLAGCRNRGLLSTRVGAPLNKFSGFMTRVRDLRLGKIRERTQSLKTPAKLHRLNGPHVLIRAHKMKVDRGGWPL